MHATVVAMALDVPVIGFEWDPKVLQLFTYCGKPKACVSIAEFMQRTATDIITDLLRQTPAKLAPLPQSMDRNFRHAPHGLIQHNKETPTDNRSTKTTHPKTRPGHTT